MGSALCRRPLTFLVLQKNVSQWCGGSCSVVFVWCGVVGVSAYWRTSIPAYIR